MVCITKVTLIVLNSRGIGSCIQWVGRQSSTVHMNINLKLHLTVWHRPGVSMEVKCPISVFENSPPATKTTLTRGFLIYELFKSTLGTRSKCWTTTTGTQAVGERFQEAEFKRSAIFSLVSWTGSQFTGNE